MEQADAINTALALAGAALALQAATLELMIDKGLISASDALETVQQLRTELESKGQPGGVRSSVYLELVEEKIRASTRD